MSKYLLNPLKFSGSIVGIYCLSLALAPIAYSIPTTNVSTTTGTNVSTASGTNVSTASGSALAAAQKNQAEIIRQLQLIQTQLTVTQSNFDAASARLSQLIAQLQSSTPSISPRSAPASLNSRNTQRSGVMDATLENPDSASTPDKTNKNVAAQLAEAKEAKAKAAAELAQAQAQARQLLASTQKAPASTQNTEFRPLW
jgi:hypothetical protein